MTAPRKKSYYWRLVWRRCCHLLDLKRVGFEAHCIHLIVVEHVLINCLLNVAWQVGHYHRTFWFRRRRLERVRCQDTLKPWHPLLEHGKVLWIFLPVEHSVLELDTDLVAKQSKSDLWKKNQSITGNELKKANKSIKNCLLLLSSWTRPFFFYAATAACRKNQAPSQQWNKELIKKRETPGSIRRQGAATGTCVVVP